MPAETIDNRGFDIDTLRELTAGTAISTPIVVKPTNENPNPTPAPKSTGTASGGSAGAPATTQRSGSQEKPAGDVAAGVRDAAGERAAGDIDPEDQRDDEPGAVPSLDWTRATEARKQLKTRVKELEAELGKLKGRTVGSSIDPTEYETLKKSKQELEDQVQSIAIERSPKFQAWYRQEYETIREVAKGISSAHAAQIEKVLDLPSGKQRMAEVDKLTEELSTGQVTALNVALMDVDKLNYRKNDIVTKQRDAWISQQREAESQQKQAEEGRKKEWEKSFQDVYASAAENLPIYQEREGDEDWNKQVKQNLALAKRVFNGEDMTPTDLAKTALWAAAAPTLLRTLAATQQENAKLLKELEGFRGAMPNPRAGSGAGSAASSQASETEGALDTILREGVASGFLKTR